MLQLYFLAIVFNTMSVSLLAADVMWDLSL